MIRDKDLHVFVERNDEKSQRSLWLASRTTIKEVDVDLGLVEGGDHQSGDLSMDIATFSCV